MKNYWIKYSDRRGNVNLDDYDHEDWLDYLNLYETSWILFARKTIHNSEPSGWPGTEHE